MDINALLAQAQKMQSELQEAEQTLESQHYTFESQQGLIKIQMNGKMIIEKIDISLELLNDGDKEMLEDLILMTINNAIQTISIEKEEAMSSVTSSMKIPGL